MKRCCHSKSSVQARSRGNKGLWKMFVSHRYRNRNTRIYLGTWKKLKRLEATRMLPSLPSESWQHKMFQRKSIGESWLTLLISPNEKASSTKPDTYSKSSFPPSHMPTKAGLNSQRWKKNVATPDNAGTYSWLVSSSTHIAKTSSSRLSKSKKRWTTSLKSEPWSKRYRKIEMRPLTSLGRSWSKAHFLKADAEIGRSRENSLDICSRSVGIMAQYFWKPQSMKNERIK